MKTKMHSWNPCAICGTSPRITKKRPAKSITNCRMFARSLDRPPKPTAQYVGGEVAAAHHSP